MRMFAVAYCVNISVLALTLDSQTFSAFPMTLTAFSYERFRYTEGTYMLRIKLLVIIVMILIFSSKTKNFVIIWSALKLISN